MDNKNMAMVGALVVLALAAGVLLGCSLKSGTAIAESDDAVVIVPAEHYHHLYNMSANGTTISLAVNDTFIVALPENGGSTGYTWNITSTQGLDVLDSWFAPDDSSLIGAPGTRYWVIEASSWAAAAPQEFIATLQRSWETPAGDETVFDLKISVTA